MHRDPRLSLIKIVIGALSLLLLVLSTGTLLVTYRASAMTDQSGMPRPIRTGQISSSGYNSITLPTITDTLLPSPTITITITTPTDTPTATPTNTPTATPTSTPSPTPTNTPPPKPTNTPLPKPTNAPSSSPVATATSATSLPPSTTTPGAHATPGANATATPGSDQSGGQGSTPTDSSTSTNTSVNDNGQGTSPNGQGRSFPLLQLFGGVLCSITFLFLLFIGWQQLRRYLMPEASVKLRPSGAPPWSRERPYNPSYGQNGNNPWKPTNNDQGFVPPGPALSNGYDPATSPITPPQGIGEGLPVPQAGLSYQQQYAGPPPYEMGTVPGGQVAPYGYPGTPTAGNFASSNGNFLPVTDASFPPVTDGFPMLPHASDPESAIPFNAAANMVPMNNNNGALPPALPVANGQWTGSPTNAPPDVNDPYLLEMIQQYREKGSASG